VLVAAESKAGRPLNKKEVEEIADKTVCIALSPAIARNLERERGYADLDPGRAWEQWQIARLTEE
jgi:hypothetical protein